MRVLFRGLYRGLMRAVMSEWRGEDLGRPAVVFAPHPDDEALGCGGTFIRKRRAGAPVRIDMPRSNRGAANSLGRVATSCTCRTAITADLGGGRKRPQREQPWAG